MRPGFSFVSRLVCVTLMADVVEQTMDALTLTVTPQAPTAAANSSAALN
jgi:hypothetical protein